MVDGKERYSSSGCSQGNGLHLAFGRRLVVPPACRWSPLTCGTGGRVHASTMLKTLAAAIVLSALALPSAALAQEAAKPAPPPLAASAGIKNLYTTVRGYIVAAADAMPEEHYAFKPTPDVRSFGELLGHIANANYNFCAGPKKVPSPNKANIEKTATTKAALVTAVKESFAFCDSAYDDRRCRADRDDQDGPARSRHRVSADVQRCPQLRALRQHRHLYAPEGARSAVSPLRARQVRALLRRCHGGRWKPILFTIYHRRVSA